MALRYLRYLFAFLALGAVGAATCNLLVDPFSLYHSPTVAGVNEDKVEYLKYLRLTKAYEVIRVAPEAVILGTSRSGRGLSPAHRAWKGARVYNLAVPAGSMYETLRLLQHAHATGSLRKAVLGLDFRLFNGSYVNPAFSEDRMLVAPTGEDNAGIFAAVARDLFGSLFSVDALQSSINTVRFQGWNAERLFANGRWDRVRSDYDYRGAFRAYTKASIKRLSGVEGPLAGIEHFRQLLRFAHRHGIDLRMFVSPSHVTHWLILKRMGLWIRFEQLRRELVAVNLQEAARAGQKPFPLWDFSGVNSVSMEPVPSEFQENRSMKFFWESIHYKAETGDMVLETVLGNRTQSSVGDDFGVDLNLIDVEEHLKNQSRRLDELLAAETADVQLVDGLLRGLRKGDHF